MTKLIRQIKQELKTAKHCAIYEEELNRVGRTTGNAVNHWSRGLLRTTGFASGFIVMVYAPFLTKNLVDRARAEDSVQTADALLALGAP